MPLKRFLRIAAILLAVIIVLIAGLSLFINSYFKSDRLKALITPKIEQATGRKASIGDIRISLFKGGIVITDMALARRSGKGDFVSAKELVLKYRLLPLLKKQLVINSLFLDSPYIFIERMKDGSFNFTGLKEGFKSGKPGVEGKKEKGKTSFRVAIREIGVKNAKAEFVDKTGTLPAARANADMNFYLGSLSPGSQAQSGQTQPGQAAISGEIDLKSLKALYKNIHADVFGKIKIAGEVNLALDADIEQDRIKIKGTAANYPAAPVIDLDISSQRLDLGRLLSMLPSGRTKRSKSKSTAKAGARKDGAGQAGPGISARGRLSVAVGLYKRYVIRDLNAVWRYSGGAFSVNPYRASIGGGDKVILEGSLLGAIGVGKIGVNRTINGKGQARFSKIMVRQSPIASQIAVLLGMPELSTPSFNDSLMDYVIKNGGTSLNGHLDSAALEFNPVKGTIGANKTLSILVDLKLSPALSARIGKKYLRFLTDKRGWTVVPMKITGTTEKPRVGISTAGVGKAIEKGLGGEIKRQFQKIFK